MLNDGILQDTGVKAVLISGKSGANNITLLQQEEILRVTEYFSKWLKT